jgi:hypothetical protein
MRVWLFNTNLKIPPREPIPHKWCDDRVLVCSKLQRSNDLCSLLHCVAQFTSMSSGQAVLRALVVVVVLVVTGLASFGQQMMIQKAQAAVQQAVWCVVVRCIRTIVLMCFAAQLSLSVSFERRQQMLVTYLRVPLHVRKPVSAAILLASWCHILVSVLAGCCLMVFGMQISESCGRDGHVYTAENKLQDDNLLISNNSNSNSNSNGDTYISTTSSSSNGLSTNSDSFTVYSGSSRNNFHNFRLPPRTDKQQTTTKKLGVVSDTPHVWTAKSSSQSGAAKQNCSKKSATAEPSAAAILRALNQINARKPSNGPREPFSLYAARIPYMKLQTLSLRSKTQQQQQTQQTMLGSGIVHEKTQQFQPIITNSNSSNTRKSVLRGTSDSQHSLKHNNTNSVRFAVDKNAPASTNANVKGDDIEQWLKRVPDDHVTVLNTNSYTSCALKGAATGSTNIEQVNNANTASINEVQNSCGTNAPTDSANVTEADIRRLAKKVVIVTDSRTYSSKANTSYTMLFAVIDITGIDEAFISTMETKVNSTCENLKQCINVTSTSQSRLIKTRAKYAIAVWNLTYVQLLYKPDVMRRHRDGVSYVARKTAMLIRKKLGIGTSNSERTAHLLKHLLLTAKKEAVKSNRSTRGNVSTTSQVADADTTTITSDHDGATATNRDINGVCRATVTADTQHTAAAFVINPCDLVAITQETIATHSSTGSISVTGVAGHYSDTGHFSDTAITTTASTTNTSSDTSTTGKATVTVDADDTTAAQLTVPIDFAPTAGMYSDARAQLRDTLRKHVLNEISSGTMQSPFRQLSAESALDLRYERLMAPKHVLYRRIIDDEDYIDIENIVCYTEMVSVHKTSSSVTEVTDTGASICADTTNGTTAKCPTLTTELGSIAQHADSVLTDSNSRLKYVDKYMFDSLIDDAPEYNNGLQDSELLILVRSMQQLTIADSAVSDTSASTVSTHTDQNSNSIIARGGAIQQSVCFGNDARVAADTVSVETTQQDRL